MSQTIFQNVPLVNPSFFQKLFKQQPPENAVIELNNLLASHPVKEISKQQIYEMEQRYQITLEQEFKLNLEEFYAVYLNFCLADKSFDNEDVENLNHLKSILSLDENTIEKLHHKVGEIVYRKYFEKSIANGRLAKKEEDFLEKLEKDLKLSKLLVDKIASETAGNHIRNYVENLIKNQNLSPDEEKEIENIVTSLNVNLEDQLNEQMKRQLKQLKLYWVLENLPLPTIEPDIVIQKSEYCYFKIHSVNWYELRSVRQKPSYYNSNSRILKDFYLKQNSYKAMNHSGNYLKYIDRGSIYLTNKRIVFIGSTKNLNVRFEKILELTPKSDGIEIDKETGKAAVIQLPDNVDAFCLILERLIRER
jgi:hypothetical protein